jgi:phenylpropionate dioxygenase-like ring-hydroxylating dioxygenase large terminal subunit
MNKREVIRRSPGISYQELLDKDTRPVPDVLRIDNPVFLGDHDISIDRYIDPKFHQLEKEKLWTKVWQVACREERIPNVGDVETYEINELSFFIVRTAPDTIKAFYNACLHMGRQLIDRPCNVQELRCPYHGFTWHCDGRLKHIPGMWDFPHVDAKKFNLPEVKVGTWGGFVFINMDPNCEPLEAFLGDMNKHFERYPLTERYTAAHVVKVIRCNWKAAQEPFMEALHTNATHPQILAGTGDDNSQIDVFGNYTRAITPTGTPSPHIKWSPTENEMAANAYNPDDPTGMKKVSVPEGMTFRQYGAEMTRKHLRAVIGDKADTLCDSEVMESFYFTLFPNFHPFASYNQVVHRFRPYGDRHDLCTFEIWYLAPFKGERPPPAKTTFLGPDDSCFQAKELGMNAVLIDQDVSNLEAAHRGMQSLQGKRPGLTMGVYQFNQIRNFHNLYDRYLGL